MARITTVADETQNEWTPRAAARKSQDSSVHAATAKLRRMAIPSGWESHLEVNRLGGRRMIHPGAIEAISRCSTGAIPSRLRSSAER